MAFKIPLRNNIIPIVIIIALQGWPIGWPIGWLIKEPYKKFLSLYSIIIPIGKIYTIGKQKSLSETKYTKANQKKYRANIKL
jgi:hypothetical protein